MDLSPEKRAEAQLLAQSGRGGLTPQSCSYLLVEQYVPVLALWANR